MASSPVGETQSWSLVDEIAIGALAHDPMRKAEGRTIDGAFEIFTSPIYRSHSGNSLWDDITSPRLNAGVVFNDADKTSYAYGGLAWRLNVYGPMFFDGEFGLAANDGCRNGGPGGHLAVGSNVTFHERVGIGFRLTDHVDLIATADHISHAGLFGRQNAGVTDFGLRLGYRF